VRPYLNPRRIASPRTSQIFLDTFAAGIPKPETPNSHFSLFVVRIMIRGFGILVSSFRIPALSLVEGLPIPYAIRMTNRTTPSPPALLNKDIGKRRHVAASGQALKGAKTLTQQPGLGNFAGDIATWERLMAAEFTPAERKLMAGGMESNRTRRKVCVVIASRPERRKPAIPFNPTRWTLVPTSFVVGRGSNKRSRFDRYNGDQINTGMTDNSRT